MTTINGFLFFLLVNIFLYNFLLLMQAQICVCKFEYCGRMTMNIKDCFMIGKMKKTHKINFFFLSFFDYCIFCS